MISKKEIIGLLNEKRYSELISRYAGQRKIITILISLSYDKKDVISWRAIEVIGLITGEVSKTKPDSVRNTVGRLLWMIRDESGGIGWSVPEILGEIVRNNRELCADIAPIIASFHEEIMLKTGVMRAISRMGKVNDEHVEYALPIVMSYLAAPNPTLRGYAALACGELGTSEAVYALKKLTSDHGLIPYYEDGELREKSVGEIAAEAISKIPQNDISNRLHHELYEKTAAL